MRAYGRLAPPAWEIEHYERLGALPHFNPDLDGPTPPAEVAAVRELVARADAIVMSTPEYVHALPGGFKNLLDWLVSDPAFAGKPVAVLQVARGTSWAWDSLHEVLRTMSARLLPAASISLPLGTNLVDEAAILLREDLRRLLLTSIEAVRREVPEASTPTGESPPAGPPHG